MRVRILLANLLFLVAAMAAPTAGCGAPQAAGPSPQPTTTTTKTAPSLPLATQTPVSKPTSTPANPGPVETVSSGTPATAPTATDVDAAVQTLLDYFMAVNQRDYSRAYRYWAGQGAASGQSLDEFSRGFGDTVQVTVLLGQVSSQELAPPGGATVAATVFSVVNQPDHSQRVEQFQGSYTLRPTSTAGTAGWEIASANVAPATGPLPRVEVADPTTVLRSYFDAINRHEYARAYSYWDQLGQASQQTYAQFEHGFATTQQVKVELGTPQQSAGAGNVYADVPAKIVATQSDGSSRSYAGTYTTHRANVPPFEKFGWRIEGAKVAAEANP